MDLNTFHFLYATFCIWCNHILRLPAILIYLMMSVIFLLFNSRHFCSPVGLQGHTILGAGGRSTINSVGTTFCLLHSFTLICNLNNVIRRTFYALYQRCHGEVGIWLMPSGLSVTIVILFILPVHSPFYRR